MVIKCFDNMSQRLKYGIKYQMILIKKKLLLDKKPKYSPNLIAMYYFFTNTKKKIYIDSCQTILV